MKATIIYDKASGEVLAVHYERETEIGEMGKVTEDAPKGKVATSVDPETEEVTWSDVEG